MQCILIMLTLSPTSAVATPRSPPIRLCVLFFYCASFCLSFFNPPDTTYATQILSAVCPSTGVWLAYQGSHPSSSWVFLPSSCPWQQRLSQRWNLSHPPEMTAQLRGIPGWPGTHYVNQTGSKFTELLHLPPGCWLGLKSCTATPRWVF